MIARLLNRGSLSNRIVLLLLALLVTVEGVAFAALNFASISIARNKAAQDLDVAQRVFERQLSYNRDKLIQSSRLLSADFGFREAVATQDAGTIASALQNHGHRIGASFMLLFSLDGTLMGNTMTQGLGGETLPFADLLARARREGFCSSVATMGSHGYQVVVVPVMAPQPIAWVAMGFNIDDRLAADFHNLTTLNVSFFSHDSSGEWQLLASSLPADARPALKERLGGWGSAQGKSLRVDLDGQEYQLRLLALSSAADAAPVMAVLQRSVGEAMAPFNRLREVLLVLALASLVLSGFVGYVTARGITGPLASLTRSAQRMREGQYDEPITGGRDDEIGVLADSLNHMREGIAEREAAILRLAYRDALTDLPNRLQFNSLMREAINLAVGAQRQFAVIVLGINRFRLINFVLDHNVGDDVLREVARRVRAWLPAQAGLARLGGDEFGILLPLPAGTEPAAFVEAATMGMVALFDTPVDARGQPVDVVARFGISIYPDDGGAPETLLRHADSACFAAKNNRAAFAFYDAATMSARRDHLSLLGKLRKAIEQDDLSLHYQPKIDLASGEVNGVEALARWQHRELGLISPGEFIPFAEKTGYIRAITRWALRTAIRDCERFHSEGTPLRVAVNLSTKDLLDNSLADYIADLLAKHGVDAGHITLEITESSLMEDPQRTTANLGRLDRLGVKLAVDDFGVGYSSLSYLRDLPVDELKMDRSFVHDIADNPKNRAIIGSTVNLAHALGLTVTAEGVEDQRCMEQLQQSGCDTVQGYFISRPLPLPALRTWLRERRLINIKPAPALRLVAEAGGRVLAPNLPGQNSKAM